MQDHLKVLVDELNKIGKNKVADDVEKIVKASEQLSNNTTDTQLSARYEEPEGTAKKETSGYEIVGGYKSLDELVKDQVVHAGAVSDSRIGIKKMLSTGTSVEQVISFYSPQEVARRFGLDDADASTFSDLITEEIRQMAKAYAPKPAASVGKAAPESRSTQFRFPVSSSVKKVQEALGFTGASIDGMWGRNTDAKWNIFVSNKESLGEDYKVGGPKFPKTSQHAMGIVTTGADPLAEEDKGGAPTEAPKDEISTPTPAPEEPAEEGRSDAVSQIREIALTLSEQRGGQPAVKAIVDAENNPQERGIALVEWSEPKGTEDRFDTIVQKEDGSWSLGSPTRREQRILMRQYRGNRGSDLRQDRRETKKDVKRELRRERRSDRRDKLRRR